MTHSFFILSKFWMRIIFDYSFVFYWFVMHLFTWGSLPFFSSISRISPNIIVFCSNLFTVSLDIHDNLLSTYNRNFPDRKGNLQLSFLPLMEIVAFKKGFNLISTHKTKIFFKAIVKVTVIWL